MQNLWFFVEPMGNRWNLSSWIGLQAWNVTSCHCRFKQFQVYQHYFETYFTEFIAPNDMNMILKKVFPKSSPYCFSFSNPQLGCKNLNPVTMWWVQLSGVTLSRDWPTPELKVLNLSLSYVCPLPSSKRYKFKRPRGNSDSRKVYIFRRQFDEIADRVLLS